MSTTTGADTALDLDAIERRFTADPIPDCRVCHAELEVASMGGGRATEYACPRPYAAGFARLGSPEWKAQSEHYGRSKYTHFRSGDSEVLALVAEVRRLRPRVITGDVEAVTAALDGLPVGSIITTDVDIEWGGDVFHRTQFPNALPTWYLAGGSKSVRSEDIARHQVPITVLREGVGA
ncbi:hypothetical protein SAMN05444374_11655 [Rhodococcoides kroppenstedtii]|uniref:Uncharacterized protein n=1 Tax=Rhodococcoides kroppenstedtii TaxID=293050 RepID=A0A1I0UAE9_9NOCA|nr:hypothetical protein [Rhodococcus kroppenstedtii]SFA60890.1 hypothetical protein SAMN05444374_11655 [Rhodococcus kroppenstedtii]